MQDLPRQRHAATGDAMTDPTSVVDAFTLLAMLLLGLASIAAAFWGEPIGSGSGDGGSK
jgi:hypothetical protein